MDRASRRYRLLLLSPAQRFVNYPAHVELARMFGRKRMMVPLSLPVVAALTPPHYDIRILDEEIEPLPPGLCPDIAGITTLAATSGRAYAVADALRARGVTVVLGGPYASFMTEEALEHADAVVVGEAEQSWPACLRDFEAGSLRRIYRSEGFCDYSRPPMPRWDLCPMDRVFQAAVQVSRGCPFACEFCLVHKMFGQARRYRDLDHVVAELRALPTRYLFFVDDNLTMDRRRARELMEAITPLGLSFGCMASLEVSRDEELLAAMARAGCFNILIGFESLNQGSLCESNKRHNQGEARYADAIAAIHRHGMHINASFIVGFDNDTLAELDRIHSFALDHALPHVNLHVLSAQPGTELHQRLKSEGRLFPVDRALGVGFFPMMHYMNFSQVDLLNGYMETIQKIYSPETALIKARALFEAGTFTRPGAPIRAWLKVRLTAVLLRAFLFTRDRGRRRLLATLVGLVRRGRLARDRAFAYLLGWLSCERHIQHHLRRLDEYRALVRENDRGPWKDRAGLPASLSGAEPLNEKPERPGENLSSPISHPRRKEGPHA